MKYLYIAIVAIAVLVVAFATVKKVSPVGWGFWGTTNTSAGVALKGHDPVAYFRDSAATKGSPELTHEWADATWHFASAENRDAFAEDPQKFAPQFGGFCSFAVGKGFTADTDPDAWHIENEKLYVFADKNVRDEWVEGLGTGTLETSESNWAKR